MYNKHDLSFINFLPQRILLVALVAPRLLYAWEKARIKEAQTLYNVWSVYNKFRHLEED
jgi:hypothetical protein